MVKTNPMTLGRKRRGGGARRSDLAKKSAYTPKLSRAAKKFLKKEGL